ncbi:MAG: site-2 protease family protein [Candidatus Latescibacteria bacterium]|nr:site-2 protease family protein [Candidatus Latescibacterota bacterium]
MQYRRIIIRPEDGYFKNVDDVIPLKRPSYRIHILLFTATVFTTTAVGAIMSGSNPFTSFQGFFEGFPFSLTLLCILGVHEFGHYFTARFWKIQVTLPYFIPAPFLPIGTFGAVIRMKSSIPSRKALVDVGVSGPLAGFIIALVASYFGLLWSEIDLTPAKDSTYPMMMLGESLIFKALGFIVHGNLPHDAVINLHPVAYAGWLGLFVTALNLIPLGQLDGGHVLFALSPRIHELFRRLRLPVLVLMGITFWYGWFVWAVLSFVFARNHPYPDYMESDIGLMRTCLSITALIIFILCFTPTPIKVG